MADLIRYDLLAQDALRGVVRRVLTDVARDGLPGDHHLYIAFDTRRPGVRLSSRMRERYPEEMTIVLQHQFWDLNVNEQGFEVGLSFGGVPERLLVPFSAMKGFFDPSVQFGLQFEADEDAKSEDAPVEAGAPSPAPLALAPAPDTAERKPRAAPKPAAKPEPARIDAPNPDQANIAGAPGEAPRDTPKVAAKADADIAGRIEKAPPKAPGEAPAEGAPRSAEIVSIDRFRKK